MIQKNSCNNKNDVAGAYLEGFLFFRFDKEFLKASLSLCWLKTQSICYKLFLELMK